MDSGARGFPLYLREKRTLFGEESWVNLTKEAASYLAAVNSEPRQLFFHCLATLHSAAYRNENADAIRQDWPRILLPQTGERLAASAALGETVAGLLNPEGPGGGVTTGRIRPELRPIAAAQHNQRSVLNPAADFAVTAGWGYTVRDGSVTMPGGGTFRERDYSTAELEAVTQGAAALNLTTEAALALLGATTYDVYLNDHAYWANVPARVWEYTIGGYQVLKKWLSYREEKVLGRPLTLDEVRAVTAIARRIAALLLLQPQLDANYQAIKANE
jgi:hypothetical protein